jgi:hypothetical protein
MGFRAGRRRVASASPLVVAGAATLAYAVLVGALWKADGIESFVRFGSSFTHASQKSAAIGPTLHAVDRTGYDGQYYYAIAADPANARYYMHGQAGYRYPRIVYPMLARALSLGRPGAVAYALVAINLTAVGAAVLALALWLRRRATSPWLALLYALFPGFVYCVYCDLTEPLAFALALVAVVVLDGGGRRAVPVAAALFAAAALTRETTVVFPAVYAAALLAAGDGRLHERVRRNAARAAGFSAIAFVPLVLERLAFGLWLGSFTSDENKLSIWPFAGLAHWWPWNAARWLVVLPVVVPALAWAATSLFALRRQRRSAELWLVLVNVAAFVVFLPAATFADYGAAGRASLGAVAGGILAYPTLRASRLPKRGLDGLVLVWSPITLALAVCILALTL